MVSKRRASEEVSQPEASTPLQSFSVIPIRRTPSHAMLYVDGAIAIPGGSSTLEVALLQHSTEVTGQRVELVDQDGMRLAKPVGADLGMLVEEVGRLRLNPVGAADLALTILQSLVDHKMFSVEDMRARLAEAFKDAAA